jgi:ATP-dependent Clp endopeptidase proteolytic subunit ClpP
MKNKWYEIQAKDESATIYIYDEISSWGITASQFVKDLNAVKAKTISLRINSPGGNVFDGMAIYNALKNHPAKVTAEIDGIAASISSIVAMAGEEIRIAENGFFMIHNAWALAIGTSAEMMKMSETLDKIDTQMEKIYAKRTGQHQENIRNMMAEETWMNADEAKAFGFADSIGDQIAAAACMSFDLTKFRNVPGNLNAGSERVEPGTERELEKYLRDAGASRAAAHEAVAKARRIYQRDADEAEAKVVQEMFRSLTGKITKARYAA